MSNELAPPQANPLVPVPLEVQDMMERSRIDTQIMAANKHPRPPVEVIEQRIAKRALRRPEVAELCYYSVPRGRDDDNNRKLIHGASIKLANIALGEWGNTLSGAYTIANDGAVIRARGVCWDLESNNQKFVEVQRRILNKYGQPYSYDMQIVTAQAANSIAERNAILKVLGSDLYEPIVAECMKIVAGDVKDLAESREKAMRWFAAKGVNYAQILQLLEREGVDDLTQEDVAYLRGLANAVKDKAISLEEAFTITEGESPGQKKRSLRDRAQAWKESKKGEETK